MWRDHCQRGEPACRGPRPPEVVACTSGPLDANLEQGGGAPRVRGQAPLLIHSPQIVWDTCTPPLLAESLTPIHRSDSDE